jgi:HAE1 family hydrophobic/amphiphilic exporter-1
VDEPLRQKRAVRRRPPAALKALDIPRGYSPSVEDDLVSTRQDSELRRNLRSAAAARASCSSFLLMGVLFESFLLPISVLFTIPFAVVGALWTMYVTHTAMDSIGWIGVIILVGVVVNNGIVLIDRIHQLRHEGRERTAAILEGSANRVRPVLMTALTTVTGLIPMALTEPPGEGIDYRALATCVAGGLSVSTIFTLWIVPLAYALLDDLRNGFSVRVVRWKQAFLAARAASKEAVRA